jgi:hypothetical protein
MFGDFDQAALHARALKTLVAQNGGYGALGLFGGFHAQGVFSYVSSSIALLSGGGRPGQGRCVGS